MKYSDESNAADFVDLYVHGLCVACDHNLTGDKANVFASNFADGAMLERARLLSQIQDRGITLEELLEELGNGENVVERYLELNTSRH